MHDLSLDVLNGLGMDYKQGHAHAPGYLVSTWQVWEDLLTVGARLGFGRSTVSRQEGFALGTKQKVANVNRLSTISVFPDCVIESNGIRPRMLLDAKYKGHVEKGTLRIAEADVYEAFAFSKATGCERVLLAYPALPTSVKLPVGTCSVFERVEIDTVQIVGVQVETRGISKRDALRIFSSTIAQQLPGMFA